jgi:Spy/CpxP family protein refolding chaperone
MKFFLTVATVLATVSLAGCASSNRALDSKLAQEPPVKNSNQLSQEADQLIRDDQYMTPEQKTKVQALRESAKSQFSQIEQHELRLRTVLLEELLSPNYNLDEVAMIKTRLKDLEGQRLALSFKMIDDTKTILGRDQTESHRKLLRAMLNEPPETIDHRLE